MGGMTGLDDDQCTVIIQVTIIRHDIEVSMERRSSRASSLVSRSSVPVGGDHARPNHVSDADKENKHWHQPGHLTGTLNVVLVPTVPSSQGSVFA